MTLLAAVPNLITIARLCCVPLLVDVMLDGHWEAAFAIFVVAGLSDMADGALARRFGLQSELGAYLDPIADKALLVAIYATLAVDRIMPAALTIVVISRDVLIVGALLLARLLDKPMAIRPLFVSKLNTAAQIGFAAAVLAAQAFGIDLEPWRMAGAVVVAALTLASAGAYLARWLAHMAA